MVVEVVAGDSEKRGAFIKRVKHPKPGLFDDLI